MKTFLVIAIFLVLGTILYIKEIIIPVRRESRPENNLSNTGVNEYGELTIGQLLEQ